MKRTILGMTLLGVAFSAGLWAHHAAEGIVSDEIWDMIEKNLQDASSPHLENFELVTDNAMDGADTFQDPDTGDMYLLSVSTLYYDGVLTEAEWDAYVLEFIETVAYPSLDDVNQIPSGTLNEDTWTVVIDYVLVDNPVNPDGIIDWAEISVYEPIGTMRRTEKGVKEEQVKPVPCKRAGG